MEGSPKTRPGGRSARVREAVIDATLALLDADEHPMTVEKVAERAGVNKTTIYRRWVHLDGVLADALRHLASRQVPIPDSGDFEHDLAELADLLRIAITASAGGKVMLALFAAAPRSDAAADAIRMFLTDRFREASVIVERAIERGDLRPDTDRIAVVETLGAPFYLRLLVTREPIDVAFCQRVAAVAAAAARAGAM